jgi:WD40 repeat protein
VFTGALVAGPLRHPAPINQIAFSPQGDRLVTAGDDWAARVWRVATGELAFPALRHGGAVRQVRFSPDGRLVASAGDDHRLRVWDAATGEPVTPFLEHQGGPGETPFGDGAQLLTTGMDGTLRLWACDGPPKQEDAAPAEGKDAGRRRFNWSADGTTVQVADARTDDLFGSPLRHPCKVNHAALSPDGRSVLTAGEDGMARIWEIATGRQLTQPLRHQGPVRFAGFSPDGQQVVTASADRTARVWNATTGAPLTPPLWHPWPVTRAVFSRDGSRAVTRCGGRLVRTWDLTPDDRPAATLAILTQVLAGARIDDRGAPVPLTPDELRAAWSEVGGGSRPAHPTAKMDATRGEP